MRSLKLNRGSMVAVLVTVVAVALLPNISTGGPDPTRADSGQMLHHKYYNLPARGRHGKCRELNTSSGLPALRDYTGNPLRLKTNDKPLRAANRAITAKFRRQCPHTAKTVKNGRIFQPFEAIWTPHGNHYYTWGGPCPRTNGRCYKSVQQTAQSGGVLGRSIKGDLTSISNEGAPGCTSINDIRVCNGRAAPDIKARNGTNLSVVQSSNRYRSYVYEVSPRRLEKAHGFFGRFGGRRYRDAVEYGYASPFSVKHRNMIWSIFDVDRGGMVRAMVSKKAQFHRAAVSMKKVYTKNRADKTVGALVFYYGFVEDIYGRRIYGWVLAASKLKNHGTKRHLKVLRGDASEDIPPVDTLKGAPGGIDFDALADDDLAMPEAQLEEDADIEDESMPEDPEGSDYFACESCNSLGSADSYGDDNQLAGDVNGDGLDDGIGISDGSWVVATNRDGVLKADRTWITNFGGTEDEQYVGDVNGDGSDDAISVDTEAGTWDVALSNGHAFEAGSSWATGFAKNSDWQFVADVTGDGRADAVAVDVDSGNWYVSASSGHGFDGPATRWVSGLGGASAVPMVGDVNGDGRTDAGLLDFEAGDWYIALSTGRGFSAAVQWGSEMGPKAGYSFLSDVTGDGKADAVFVDENFGGWHVAPAASSAFSSEEQWLGTFGTEDEMLQTGDFNGDGIADAAQAFEDGTWKVATSTGTAFSGYGSWLGSDDEVNSTAATSSSSADVNGDGMSDAAWLDEHHKLNVGISNGNQFEEGENWSEDADSSAVQVLTGQLDDSGSSDEFDDVVTVNGDGDWQVFKGGPSDLNPEGEQLSEFGASGVRLLGDVDGDGDADAIAVDASGEWSVALRDDNSFLTAAPWTTGLGGDGFTPLVADVDGDGTADAISVDRGSGDWRVAISSGSSFGTATLWASDFGADSLNQLAGDLDGDGKADAVYVQKRSANWFVAESNGTDEFETPSRLMTVAGAGSDGQMLADTTGDNVLDAVTVYNPSNYWFVNSDTTKSLDIKTPGITGFETPTNWLSASAGSGVALSGDTNGDGKSDAILFDPSDGSARVALAGGSPGSFGGGTDYDVWATGIQTWYETLTVADFNGDGNDDIVSVSPTYFDWGEFRFRSDWDVWISDGSTEFVKDPGIFDSDNDLDWFKFKDFAIDVNGDGKADAVEVEQFGDIYVALSNGDSFAPASRWYVNYSEEDELDPQTYSVAGDFDGDGKFDLAVSPQDNAGEWWVLNSTGSEFEQAAEPFTSSFAPTNRYPLSADVSGDGKADLIDASPSVGVWNVLSSENENEESEPWNSSFGSPGDQVVAGDVNGDGQADAIDYSPNYPGGNWSVGLTKRTAPTTEVLSGPQHGQTVQAASVTWTFSSRRGESAECAIDGGTWVSCASPYTPSTLSDGDHTFAVRSLAGTVAELDPVTIEFKVDSSAPDTSISSGPSGGATISTGHATFEFSSADSTAKFDCNLDSSGLVPCKSPYTVSVLDGNHTFSVVAHDGAGNQDSTPAEAAFIVTGSSVAVDTTITSGPASISSDPDPEFEFSATGNDSFECRIDGKAWSECASPMSIRLPEGVSADYDFEVRSITNGFPDPTPAMHEWHADLEPPTVTIDAPAADESFTDPTIEVGFSATGTIVDSWCIVDDEEPVPCEDEDTIEVTESGWHTLVVAAENAAGNVGSSSVSFQLAVDLETNLYGPETPLDTSVAQFDFYSSDESADFECRVDDGSWASCESPYELDISSFEDGIYDFQARSKVGEVVDSEPGHYEFQLDTTAPEQPSVTTPEPVTSDFTPLIESEVLDENDDPVQDVTFTCTVDDGPSTECAPKWDADELNDGTHVVSVVAADRLGHESDAESVVVTVDTTAPDAVISNTSYSYLGAPERTFHFGSNEANVDYECSIDSPDEESFEPCETPFTTDPLDADFHELRVRATDVVGNVGPVVAQGIQVSEPSEDAPSISSGPTGTTSDPTPTFGFSATSVPSGWSYECQIDDYPASACTSPYTALKVSTQTFPLADGAHSFSTWLKDSSSNDVSERATQTFEVDSGLTAPDTIGDSDNPLTVGWRHRGVIDYHASDTPAKFYCRMFGHTSSAWDGAYLGASPDQPVGQLNRCTRPFVLQSASTWTNSTTTVWVQAAVDGVLDPTPLRQVVRFKSANPTIQFVSAPEGTTDEPEPEFRFRTNDSLVTEFECSIDGAEYQVCHSPFKSDELSDGDHSFSVRASDDYANSSQSIVAFEIDTGGVVGEDLTPPDSFVRFAEGTELYDSTVGTNSVHVQFSATEDATYECHIDSEPFDECAGSASFYSLADGSHTIEVVASDLSENVDSTPGILEFTVDNTAPTLAVTYPSAGQEIHTGDLAVDVSSNEPLDALACYMDFTFLEPCNDPGPQFSGLSAGSHSLLVLGTDQAGNFAMTSRSFSYRTAPETTITEGPSENSTLSGNDTEFEFSSSDSSASFECKLDSGSYSPCGSPEEYLGMGSGSHTFYVYAVSADTTEDPTPATRTFIVP